MNGTSEGQFLSDARRLIETLGPMSARMPAELSQQPFRDAVDALEAALAEVKRLTNERLAAVDAKNVRLVAARELVVRIKGAVRAVYGPDSIEYESVGGTRRSDRKKPARKATGTPA